MVRELQTFLAVCRAGTFTAAAERLGMTQSAVSDHMRRLEEMVGATLFHRTGRSATLNPAGARLVPLAQEAVVLMDRMRQETVPGILRGGLRVGTVASLHNTVVARAMMVFRRLHPEVVVRLIRHEGVMLPQVERGELDVAVVVHDDTPVPRTMTLQPLMRLPFVMIAPASLPEMGWREAAVALPLLRYDQSSPTGHEVDAFLGRQGLAIRDSLWINYLDTIISLVGEELGVAFVPRTPLGMSGPRIRVIELGEATFHRRIGILRRADGSRDGVLADRFADTLASEAAREPHAILGEAV